MSSETALRYFRCTSQDDRRASTHIIAAVDGSVVEALCGFVIPDLLMQEVAEPGTSSPYLPPPGAPCNGCSMIAILSTPAAPAMPLDAPKGGSPVRDELATAILSAASTAIAAVSTAITEGGTAANRHRIENLINVLDKTNRSLHSELLTDP